MLHTYTVIKKNMSVVNHLEWQQALDIAEDGDMVLTIKDNHVSAIRKIEVVDYYGEDYKENTHIAGSITPFYQ
jgi:hypothetical protein